jgi:hypothetical protein
MTTRIGDHARTTGRPVAFAAAALIVALTLDIVAVGLYLAIAGDPDVLATLDPSLLAVQLLFVAPFAVVGALIVVRRPTNVIGRSVLLTGLLLAVYVAGRCYLAWGVMVGRPSIGEPLVLVVSFAVFYVMSGIVVPWLLLHFPDGRLPGPRWRAVYVAQAAGVAVLLVALLTPGDLGVGTGVENPIGTEALGVLNGITIPLLDVIVDALTVIAGASLVVRFRRARGVERAQLKVFAWFGILAAVSLIGHQVLSRIAPWMDPVTDAIGGAAGILFPIGIWMAVMRYHLYDIDRLISRGIGWAIVTGLLAAAFVALVLGLTSVLQPVTGGSTLAVAGSTLLVVAIFQPLRTRVQRALDQRFDRSRYDGERLLSALGERLRYEVDLETICADVLTTVDAAVRPVSVGLWLRGDGPRWADGAASGTPRTSSERGIVTRPRSG